MSKIDFRHTGTFKAKDSSGKTYTVFQFTKFERIDTFGGSEWVEGLKSLRLSDGTHVNWKEKGIYETVGVFGNVGLTSDDPAAP